MSSAQFTAILQKLAGAPAKLQKLHFNWRGEPLTNKQLVEFLKIRRQILPDVSVELHTNGLLLSRRISADIVEHALEGDLFYVSIDGGRREAHEGNRGVGTWYRTLRALEMLLDARDDCRIGSPRIGIYEIFYGDRSPYDPELVALSRRCDEWSRVSPIQTAGSEQAYDNGTTPFGPCFWAGHSLCVTARGDAYVCLLSFSPDGWLGNLLTDDIGAILDRARAFRNALQSGRSGIRHCRSCQKCEGEPDES